MSKVKKEEILGPFGTSMSEEAIRLFRSHREIYHSEEKRNCKICRSLRRTIMGGFEYDK